MDTISKPMTHDHRQCDDLFVEIEQTVMQKAWEEAESVSLTFERAMMRHFGIEEEQLFPAMEQASAQANAPVRVMTMEHDQMRHLIAKLRSAIGEREKERALGISETLLVTMQQHNMKEENVLYPMADRLVPALAADLAQGMMEYA